MEQRTLYIHDLARLLGMTENALRIHLCRKNFSAVPQPVKLGHRIAWREQDVHDWLHREGAFHGKILRGPGRARKKKD